MRKLVDGTKSIDLSYMGGWDMHAEVSFHSAINTGLYPYSLLTLFRNWEISTSTIAVFIRGFVGNIFGVFTLVNVFSTKSIIMKTILKTVLVVCLSGVFLFACNKDNDFWDAFIPETDDEPTSSQVNGYIFPSGDFVCIG